MRKQVSSIFSNVNHFNIIAGNPALDFINTQVIEAGVQKELLDSDRDLLEWAHAASLLRVPPRALRQASGQALDAKVRPLRAALRSLFEACVDGKRPPQKAIARVNEMLLLPVAGAPLSYQRGHFEVNADQLSIDACRVLHEVAVSASGLLTSKDLERVRRCANDRCILFFVDRSRGVARRWCSMSACGNRAKVAAHQRRFR